MNVHKLTKFIKVLKRRGSLPIWYKLAYGHNPTNSERDELAVCARIATNEATQ